MNLNRLLQDENFLLKLGSQAAILSVLCLVIAARGMQAALSPVDMIVLSVFNILIWCRKPAARCRLLPLGQGVHAYLAVQTLLLSWLVVQDIIYGLLLFILYVQSILLAPGRSKLAWMLLFVSVVTVGNLYWHPGSGVVITPVMRGWGFLSFLALPTLLAFQQLRARRKNEEISNLVEELADANRSLQAYTERAAFLATAEERTRIARDLHDDFGHRLTVSIVQMEGVPHLLRENQQKRAITVIENVTEQLRLGLQEMRGTVRAMRATDITSENLTDRLQRLADEFGESTNVEVWTRLPDALPPSLSDAQSLAIYRVVQEAFTNTVRHAKAQNIWMNLNCARDNLILTVRNDGWDFPLSDDSLKEGGLQGMQERSALLGGTLTVERPGDGGTLVTLTIPLEAAGFPQLALDPT